MSIGFIYDYKNGLYQLDFYNEELKKYVEIDGNQHMLPQSIERDIKRDNYLKSLGWEGVRIVWSEYQKLNNDDKKKQIDIIKDFLT